MIENSPLLKVLYFTGKDCSVCKVLKPKVKLLLVNNFPQVSMNVIDVAENPVLAVKHSVFTLPVVLIMVDDKEHDRLIRSFSVHEIQQKLQRLLDILNS